MLLCYVCQSEITRKNESEEHIIPNSIGGKITSKKLLCQNCNNSFGTKYEGNFSRQLEFLSNRLPIKKDRGKNKKLNATAFIDNKYLPVVIDNNGNVSLKSRFIDKNESSYKCTVPDENDANRLITELNNKYPNKKIDIEFDNNINLNEEFQVQFEVKFGDISFLKTSQKILLNFYIENGGIRGYINDEIEKVFKLVNKPRIQFYSDYPPDNLKINLNHILAIFGRSDDKILFGYLELFGAIRMLSILSDNYTGPEIYFTHGVNPIESSIFKPEVNIEATREKLISLVDQENINIEAVFAQIKLAENEIQLHHKLTNIVEDVLKNKLGKKNKNKNKIITINESKEIAKEIANIIFLKNPSNY